MHNFFLITLYVTFNSDGTTHNTSEGFIWLAICSSITTNVELFPSLISILNTKKNYTHIDILNKGIDLYGFNGCIVLILLDYTNISGAGNLNDIPFKTVCKVLVNLLRSFLKKDGVKITQRFIEALLNIDALRRFFVQSASFPPEIFLVLSQISSIGKTRPVSSIRFLFKHKFHSFKDSTD